ncbi:ras-like GTP-binding protein RhoL [Ctenocephalides felis]|uniref:ras-like GTP-binding protein RhoL n=1 Tax=Ctenocephalides felis TaxID=7515 RepID=UPI000E6E4A7F|nr:ras-like GTP-binding protein RhoL [Ctenocephalides felis]
MAEERKKSIRVTAVGDGVIGKTCLLITYTKGVFPCEYIPTVFENYTANILVDGCTHILNVWDTSGQEDYDRLRPLSYPNTDCFLLCYSISSRDSFDHVHSKWYPEIRHYSPKAPIILIATKIDLRNSNSHGLVTFEEGQAMHKKIRSSDFVECSALEYTNVDIVFIKAVRAVLQKENAARKLKCNPSGLSDRILGEVALEAQGETDRVQLQATTTNSEAEKMEQCWWLAVGRRGGS